MAEAGADVIEVGLPYSDPLMDGPVIADAVYHALHGRHEDQGRLRHGEAVADAGTAALVMTYWNPVDHYGADAFARDLASAGGAGLITPDLTPEEARPWLERPTRTTWTASSWSPRPPRKRASRPSRGSAAASSTRSA